MTVTSVQWSPFTAIFSNRASGTVIVGSPGSGKSYFMLNVAANCLLMRQNVFAIDPKDDLSPLASMYPDQVELIDINNIQAGALNPFRVLHDVDTNTISSVISIICGGLSDQAMVAVTPIINDFVIRHGKKRGHVSFSDVVDYLYASDNEHAQAVGTKLQIHRDAKYGGLLFDDGSDVQSDPMGDRPSKVVSLLGMDLPKGQGESMNEDQKFNAGVVYVICRMLREHLTGHGYPTLFMVDEAHIAFSSEAFRSMIDEFLVLGRSLNVPTVLASQSVSHYPETVSQLVSTKFCFKSSSKDAMGFLRLFAQTDGDSEADHQAVMQRITQFQTGDCLMIDSSQRLGIFHVTSLFDGGVTSNPLLKKRR